MTSVRVRPIARCPIARCPITLRSPSMRPQVFEQSITIRATATRVEQCFTDRDLMHRWLNPALRCDPVGEWNTDLGGQTRFVIQVPWLEPTLESTVVERRPGLVVWEFSGFFSGRDRWECQPVEETEAIGGVNTKGANIPDPTTANPRPPVLTRLLNRFEFTPSNPIVAFGFQTFAARWTQRDMEAQLRRLKRVAETLP